MEGVEAPPDAHQARVEQVALLAVTPETMREPSATTCKLETDRATTSPSGVTDGNSRQMPPSGTWGMNRATPSGVSD